MSLAFVPPCAGVGDAGKTHVHQSQMGNCLHFMGSLKPIQADVKHIDMRRIMRRQHA